MLRDIPPSRNPDIRFIGDVLHKDTQRLTSSRLPYYTRMQWDIHHLAALAVQHVEGILEILLVALTDTRTKTRRHVEFAVVAVILSSSVHFTLHLNHQGEE